MLTNGQIGGGFKGLPDGLILGPSQLTGRF